MSIEKQLKCQMKKFIESGDVTKFTKCTGTVAAVYTKNCSNYVASNYLLTSNI